VLVPVAMKITQKLSDVTGWRAVYRDSQFAMFARDGLTLPSLISDDDPPEGQYP
jgi:hypothetical protein